MYDLDEVFEKTQKLNLCSKVSKHTVFQDKDWRYITEGVWMRETYVQRFWVRFLRLPKKERGQPAYRALEPFAKAYTKFCFLGGEEGLEIVNLYLNHPHPLTAKKNNVLKREFSQILSSIDREFSCNSILQGIVIVSKFVSMLQKTKCFFPMIFPTTKTKLKGTRTFSTFNSRHFQYICLRKNKNNLLCLKISLRLKIPEMKYKIQNTVYF